MILYVVHGNTYYNDYGYGHIEKKSSVFIQKKTLLRWLKI